MKSILVPLDGATLGEHALPVAQGLARSLGATLRLVHVHTPIVSVEVGGVHGGNLPSIDEIMDADSREHEEAYLEALIARMASDGSIQVSSELIDGDVADTLADYASETESDLVVIATHGRSQLGRVLLGSITDELVRRTNAPLLVVKPSTSAIGPAQLQMFRHILVTLDGSLLAERILAPTIELGNAMGASYTLVQVVEPIVSLSGDAFLDQEETMRRWDHADRYLERVARPLRAEGMEVNTHAIIAQSPPATILEHAHRCGADLIATSTHGRSGLSRLLFGSVADAVVRHAHTPVLVMRPYLV